MSVDAKAVVGDLVRRLGVASPVEPFKRECTVPAWPLKPVVGERYCDAGWHFVVDEDGVAVAEGKCQVERRREIRQRVAREHERLAGPLERLGKRGGYGFEGYAVRENCPGAKEALERMVAFSDGRPPRRNVMLVGPLGLGKTRLLVASHFALLEAGVASQYVTTPELRRHFRRAESFDEEVAKEAQRALDLYVYAEVVHFDDAGHIENDQRARGQFAEGLKHLIDTSRATWALATNRTSQEAEAHPDLSGAIVSRFADNTDVVVMAGDDYRGTP